MKPSTLFVLTLIVAAGVLWYVWRAHGGAEIVPPDQGDRNEPRAAGSVGEQLVSESVAPGGAVGPWFAQANVAWLYPPPLAAMLPVTSN